MIAIVKRAKELIAERGYMGVPEWKIIADAISELETIISTHDLCHNLHGKVDAQAFADGCAEEQRKLYGCAPDRDEVERLTKLLKPEAAVEYCDALACTKATTRNEQQRTTILSYVIPDDVMALMPKGFEGLDKAFNILVSAERLLREGQRLRRGIDSFIGEIEAVRIDDADAIRGCIEKLRSLLAPVWHPELDDIVDLEKK